MLCRLHQFHFASFYNEPVSTTLQLSIHGTIPLIIVWILAIPFILDEIRAIKGTISRNYSTHTMCLVAPVRQVAVDWVIIWG